VRLVDLELVTHGAVGIDQDARPDLELLAEDAVLLAPAAHHEHHLGVHAVHDVHERAPQGELAPGGVSELAATRVQHDHPAEVVARAPHFSLGVGEGQIDVLSVDQLRHG
jgi:hypothetical protein